jgi:hypothetical protein
MLRLGAIDQEHGGMRINDLAASQAPELLSSS